MRIASTPRFLVPPPKAEGPAPSPAGRQVDAPDVEPGAEPHAVHAAQSEFDAAAHADRAHMQSFFAGITEGTVRKLDPVKSGGGHFNEIARDMGYDPATIGASQRKDISCQFSVELGKSAGAGGPSFVDISGGTNALEDALRKVLGAPR